MGPRRRALGSEKGGHSVGCGSKLMVQMLRFCGVGGLHSAAPIGEAREHSLRDWAAAHRAGYFDRSLQTLRL